MKVKVFGIGGLFIYFFFSWFFEGRDVVKVWLVGCDDSVEE